MNMIDDAPRRRREPTGPVAPRRRRRLLVLLLGLAVAVLVADQVTKYLAEQGLTAGERVPLLGNFLSLELIYNPGAAFSFATGMTWIFTIAAVAVTIVILRVARRIGSTAWAVALGLLLGGSVGNLVDRLLREPSFAQGHVVDFLNYNGWFVGNVADIGIVVGAVLIGLLAVLGRDVDGTLAGHGAEPAVEEADDA